MQNAEQYGPGAAVAHQSQQFTPSEPSPNGGSTTSSLRQFRKKDVDKSHLDQSQKHAPEAHVARVAPHNHYPGPNDSYRYPSHQFSEYSPQAKYSDTPETSQPNVITTSVIQKPKPKDYMEMCNVQQPHMKPAYPDHLGNHQQYHHENTQYMHKNPAQIHPNGFKPESPFFSKEHHQFQQMPTHHMQMMPNIKKYSTPTPSENAFLNKLSKIRPSMARSIISDHHLQDSQAHYPAMDQRSVYPQQNPRYYQGPMYQQNQYSPTAPYQMNSAHYPNYPAASCSYPRPNQMSPMAQRFHTMERSMSPTRRHFPENLHMSYMGTHNMPQKMTPPNNYPSQYAGPEYSQHYQHRRMTQEMFSQGYRPPQYMPNHHQMAVSAHEMQEMSESRVSPSDSLKKFIENWAEEEPNAEMSAMENTIGMRENPKIRDETPAGTVYMINATDAQYFENNGIPVVAADNGGIQLSSENYQYLLKDGLFDGVVRIVEPNGNNERVVNLQIVDSPKSDCMMVNKNARPKEMNLVSDAMKGKDDKRKVVIHQNTVITSPRDVLPIQQNMEQVSLHQAVIESINASKELVDKNCSPINLEQMDHTNDFTKPEDGDSSKQQENSKPDALTTDDLDDSDILDSIGPNKSPELKSMPIIDLFAEANLEHSKSCDKDDVNFSHEDSNNLDALAKEIESVVDKSSDNYKRTIEKMESVEVNQNVEDSDDKIDKSPAHKENTISFDDLIENKPEEISIPTICNNLGANDEAVKEDSEKSDVTLPEKEENAIKPLLVSKNSNEVSENVIEKSSVKTDETKMCEENTETTDDINVTSSPPRPVAKRKRIFSVDDIIYKIGNNSKKSSVDLGNTCSVQVINSFLEQEIENSSLEQLFILEEKRKAKKDILAEAPNGNESNNIKESEDAALASDIKNSCDLKNCDEAHNLAPTPDLENLSSLEGDKCEKGDETHLINKPISSPCFVEQEQPPASPSDIQYRRAVTIEGSTVLLQLAGELMEISVNIVNGKKLITVVPISETTEVDYNDNYELSNNIPVSNVDSKIDLQLESTSTKATLESCDDTIVQEHAPKQNVEEVMEFCDLDKSSEESPIPKLDETTDNSRKDIINECASESENIKTSSEENENHEILTHTETEIEKLTLENGDIVCKDIYPEILEYPIEEEILVSDELSHEIVVSDPLEGIGELDEELVKPESLILVSEAVTTSESVAIIKEVHVEDANTDSGETLKINNYVSNDSSEEVTVEQHESKPSISIPENQLSPPKVCTQKITKPEILILSPTSTNIDDHFAMTKQNVYIHRDETPAEQEMQDISQAVTTKAAKKSYDTELQIPAVTTSGDVSTTPNKKSSSQTKHDTVSSSNKEKVYRNLDKAKKTISKQSKRNSEKSPKKEQTVSKHSTPKKKVSNKVPTVKEKITDLLVKKVKISSEKNNLDTDEEFVDFKELLKARKLRKQKKLQEMKEKDNKNESQLQDSHLTAVSVELKCGEVSSTLINPENVDNSKSGCDNTTNENKNSKRIKDVVSRLPKIKKVAGSESTKKSNSQVEAKPYKSNLKPSVPPIKSNVNEIKSSENVVNKTQKRISFSEETPSSTSSNISASLHALESVKETFQKQNTPEKSKESHQKLSKTQVIVPSVSEFMEDNSTNTKKKISVLDYLKRKRKDLSSKNSESGDCLHKDNLVENELKSNQKETTTITRTLSDIKTSFVIHSSDWEDTESPKLKYKQSSEECLIQDFSGLIKNTVKKPLVDVNELVSSENPTDVKLLEYKETVDSKLNSLNIQIPKPKTQNVEREPSKLDLVASNSPETSLLVGKFLRNEKMTPIEMEKIKQIISYKRYIQEQRKDLPPGSSRRTSKDNEIKEDTFETKLHLSKVSAKRKRETDDEEDPNSVSTNHSDPAVASPVDYSVYNLLGKDGLPKMIFKRNRQSNISEEVEVLQPVVRLERIDLDKVKELFNVTVTNMM